MSDFKLWLLPISAAVLMAAAPAAQAQFAVIDVGAITQLVSQVQTMTQQLTTMQAHLRQAQQEYQSLTGDRGMEHLLSGTVRNYLPADWASLQSAVNQSHGAYPALAAAIQTTMRANAVLTDQRLAKLSGPERAQLMATRQSTATLQTITQQALAATSERFSAIQ